MKSEESFSNEEFAAAVPKVGTYRGEIWFTMCGRFFPFGEVRRADISLQNTSSFCTKSRFAAYGPK